MERMGRADTHVHTYYSGFNMLGALRFPESVAPPSLQVDTARRNGMDVLCITDHNETAGGFVAQKYARKFDDIQVVVGDEVMTNGGEVIGLWLNERLPLGLSPAEAVDRIHEQGGLAIAPHPFSVHVAGMQEKIFDLPLEGFETINGGHPDRYSNHFAREIMDRYPGRWADLSGSDAHSKFTTGYNWTEFPGRTADEFRKAILEKKTVPMGMPAPVLTQVEWSMDVVWGGQKLMYRALRHKLNPMEDNRLYAKIISISDLKKATGLVGGFFYNFPPITMLATLLSVRYLRKLAKQALKEEQQRLGKIDAIIAERDARAGQ
ncbi:MAG: PHP-associated domain-containing protein [Candidatus Methanomethylophilus sp.]|nr:PHP-associated domain-containing protein [Methanomethylophilus sp.]MDD3232897.1 PHP-associated domain-containing protein [Methanomethylophilus sp.]MDD4221830.1 PHP-associated domain-containing protein [Methanomethylophilus sp.]MDD4668504.1 PHP-associated domain-containing protein [Methanomethylophilus sp.]